MSAGSSISLGQKVYPAESGKAGKVKLKGTGQETGRGLWKFWPDTFMGISKNGFFGFHHAWVDPDLKPGYTDQTEYLGLKNTATQFFTLTYFFFSPNLFWFLIALFHHFVLPYDIEWVREEGGLTLDMFMKRFEFNFVCCFVYYFFFYYGLYHMKWASRKYTPNYPTKGNWFHDLWYWTLAIIQWTFWELVMMRLWALGGVPFVTNEEVLADNTLIAWNVLWVLLIPVWRDFHFYFVHRLAHYRSVYKYVHALHHRNTDPQPFSGMSMHPVEHLYYFSNVFTPVIYVGGLSPLIFLWCFCHLTYAPGAGHSGWEDHFQSDQYHYLHHLRYECNYGSPFTGFIDQMTGTFREKIGESKQYQGADKGGQSTYTYATKRATKDLVGEGEWGPKSYIGIPETWDHGCYSLFTFSLMAFMGYVVVVKDCAIKELVIGDFTVPMTAELVAHICAHSPLLVGLILAKLSGDSMSIFWPFHNESFLGSKGFFLLAGWMSTALPLYHTLIKLPFNNAFTTA